MVHGNVSKRLAIGRVGLAMLAAACLGALAGTVTADGGGPSPGAVHKCPAASACGAIICGGTSGCWCDTSQAGNEVCLQN